MITSNSQEFTALFSSAIAPVTLITGVAFLTSIMTPRYGRCIDRIRTLLCDLNRLPKEGFEYENSLKQLHILYRRTKILRNTMAVAGVCILWVVLTIVTNFTHMIFGFPTLRLSAGLFLLALISLVFLAIGFIYDFLRSLNAVNLEVKYVFEKLSLTKS